MPEPNEQPTLDEILGTPVGPTEDEDTSWRRANPDLAIELDRWNANLPKGARKLSDFEAEQAQKYAALGLDFTQQLNLMWHYINNEQAPAPSAAKALSTARTDTGEMAGEIDKVRRLAGLPPAGATTGLPAGAESTVVGQAILAATDNPRTQAAMWHAVGSEGGYNGPWGAAAGGAHVGGAGEVGPWQIHPIHFGNITPEDAADPTKAAAYMATTFEETVRSVPEDVWQSDPGGAIALATARAERPEAWGKSAQTLEDAVAIYGRPETGPLQAGPGGLPTGYPQGEAARRELTPDQQNQATYLNQVYGLPHDVFVSAVDQGITDPEAIVAFWQQMKGAATVEELRAVAPEGWTEADLLYFIGKGMSIEEDLPLITTSGQKPQQWWDAQMKQTEDFLKERNLTWQDLDVMVSEEMTIPEYQTLSEITGGDIAKMRAIKQTFPDPETAWQAAQLGYDPSKMSVTQRARFALQTDPTVAIMRGWEGIPENIRPDVPTDKLAAAYDVARVEARAQGRYLSPDEFLRGDFPGLFGGGTVQQLRQDMARIQTAPQASYRAAAKGEEGLAEALVSPSVLGGLLGRPSPQTEPRVRTAWGEMQFQRGLAQSYLTNPNLNPAATQAVAARYPKLLERVREEEETEEERKRKRRLNTLTPAGPGV